MAFQTPIANTDVYKGSFFPQTIRDWNALPDSLISSAEDAEDCVAKLRIEFSNGCYDYTELSGYIKETLITNGDLEPDQASPITIEFDLTSFKCFVSIIKPFALDLRGSNFGALIRFEPTVIRQTQY